MAITQTGALSAVGTLLKMTSAAYTGSAPTFDVTIGEVTALSPYSANTDMLDVTPHLASADDNFAWRQYIGGLKDGGELTFTVNLIPTNTTHVEIKDAFETRQVRAFSITWPDSGATVEYFGGIVSGLSPSANPGDPLTYDVTVKVTGYINNLTP